MFRSCNCPEWGGLYGKISRGGRTSGLLRPYAPMRPPNLPAFLPEAGIIGERFALCCLHHQPLYRFQPFCRDYSNVRNVRRLAGRFLRHLAQRPPIPRLRSEMPGQSPRRKLLFRARMHSITWRRVRETGDRLANCEHARVAEPAPVARRHPSSGWSFSLVRRCWKGRVPDPSALSGQSRSGDGAIGCEKAAKHAIRLVRVVRASGAARPS